MRTLLFPVPPDVPVVLASTLSVRAGDKPLLRDLSFVVQQGQLVGLIGPNGSGKSTLVRAISGVIPYMGSVQVLGREVREWPARDLARRLAVVRQSQALAFDMTVEEMVLLGRSPHLGWLDAFTSSDRERVRAALSSVEMSEHASQSVLTLSGGELQRAMFAQLLVQDPAFMLLDEPTAHLDIHHQYELLHGARRLVDEGHTAVVVFHDLEMAARFSDGLLVLEAGKLVAAGPPSEILTPYLIKHVFRMEASLITDDASILRIEYHAPAGRRP